MFRTPANLEVIESKVRTIFDWTIPLLCHTHYESPQPVPCSDFAQLFMNLPQDIKGICLTRTPYAKSGKKNVVLDYRMAEWEKIWLSEIKLLKTAVGLNKLNHDGSKVHF